MPAVASNLASKDGGAWRTCCAVAAESVTELIDVSAEWLRQDVKARVERGDTPTVRTLDAYRSVQQLRRDLIQRNGASCSLLADAEPDAASLRPLIGELATLVLAELDGR